MICIRFNYEISSYVSMCKIKNCKYKNNLYINLSERS